MEIEFYEEFPSEKNLSKLSLISFPTKVFLAAKSIEEFQKYSRIARRYKKNVTLAYWPIVPNSYWISPFSNTVDLEKLFSELNKIPNPLLIDLELPLRNRFKMLVKNLFNFKRNKGLIRRFLEENKSRITTAEYSFTIVSKIMRLLGLNYDLDCERSIMWYSSMQRESFNKKIQKKLESFGKMKNVSVSLGTIAIGILGNEKILSSESLKKDLHFIKRCGFQKAIIFRLEGINDEYVKILREFLS